MPQLHLSSTLWRIDRWAELMTAAHEIEEFYYQPSITQLLSPLSQPSDWQEKLLEKTTERWGNPKQGLRAAHVIVSLCKISESRRQNFISRIYRGYTATIIFRLLNRPEDYPKADMERNLGRTLGTDWWAEEVEADDGARTEEEHELETIVEEDEGKVDISDGETKVEEDQGKVDSSDYETKVEEDQGKVDSSGGETQGEEEWEWEQVERRERLRQWLVLRGEEDEDNEDEDEEEEENENKKE